MYQETTSQPDVIEHTQENNPSGNIHNKDSGQNPNTDGVPP
jgi:hypothetical protein